MIRIENQRAKAAQDAVTGTRVAAEKQVELTNETNDILAELLAGQRSMNSLLSAPISIAAGGGPGRVIASARNVSLV